MSDEVELVECASCSSDYIPDDLATTRSGEVLCGDCRIYCEYCENFDYENGSRYVEGCGTYCEVCADNYTFGVSVARVPTLITTLVLRCRILVSIGVRIVAKIMPTGVIVATCITEMGVMIVMVVG
jgi:hypothetical protein